MTIKTIMSIVPNISDGDLKKQQKKLEKVSAKTSQKNAKVAEKYMTKGLTTGYQKASKSGGEILKRGGGKLGSGAKVFAGALAGGFLASILKGLVPEVQPLIDQITGASGKATSITSLAERGGTSTTDVGGIIDGLKKSGLTFEEATSTLDNFLSKRYAAKTGQDFQLAEFTGGSLRNDFTDFIKSIKNYDPEARQFKSGGILPGDVNALYRKNLIQNVTTTKSGLTAAQIKKGDVASGTLASQAAATETKLTSGTLQKITPSTIGNIGTFENQKAGLQVSKLDTINETLQAQIVLLKAQKEVQEELLAAANGGITSFDKITTIIKKVDNLKQKNPYYVDNFLATAFPIVGLLFSGKQNK